MKVRFAPSPTGSLHIGNALGAVANRNFGADTMLLRIDDTDPARNVPGGEEAILDDLRWLGIEWDEGPIRQSDRLDRYREAAAGLPQRVAGVTLLRDDGTATYHLASVVDDADFGITHVIRGNDHRPNEALHRALAAALGLAAPEYIHHGLILGADGKKISKRAEGGSIASLREEGIPPEAVRAYLDELGLPRHDVHLDLERIRSLSVDVIAGLSDAELAARVGVPVEVVPALRGAHDLNEARELARQRSSTPPVPLCYLPTETARRCERFRELRERGGGRARRRTSAKAAAPRAEGGRRPPARGAPGADRRDSGPELWTVIAALPRDETLRRVDAAL